MSRKGDCWDTVVESFFGTLKQEQVQWQNYQTRYETQQDITMFYNNQTKTIRTIRTIRTISARAKILVIIESHV
jgi:hypothetical protein